MQIWVQPYQLFFFNFVYLFQISAMREEKKTLTNKINDYEKQKKQMSSEIEMKQRTIQQLSKVIIY